MENIDVKELTSKVNIVEYISQYTELERKNNEWWCCSPFNKDDINPSFCVDENKQTYYCFSTHQGGDVLEFIKTYHHVDFFKAVNMLCKYLGTDPDSIASFRTLSSVYEIKKYQNSKRAQKCKTYKKLDNDVMAKFDNNQEMLSSWKNEGISTDVMKRYQVKYDKLANRIVFPIFDTEGNIINISGRTLDENYKENNIRKYTYYYDLGTLDTMYNYSQRLNDIKEIGSVIIVEGVKSVLLCETWGIKNSCAILTSALNENQLKLLIKLGVDVIFSLDEDARPLKDKKIQILKRYVNTYYIWNYNNLLSSKQSPVDNGKEIFLELYNHRRSIL